MSRFFSEASFRDMRSRHDFNNYFVTTNCGLLFGVPEGVTTETIPVVAPVPV
jgi:hypothetical protein